MGSAVRSNFPTQIRLLFGFGARCSIAFVTPSLRLWKTSVKSPSTAPSVTDNANTKGSNFSSAVYADWLYSADRTANDVTVVEQENSGYYVVLFESRDDNAYNTVNVRHILIKVDDTSDTEAMAKAGIETLDTLVSKEGLGMTNGTCAMTSVGALALYDSICAAQLGDVIASLSMEGLTGLRNAFDPRIHQVRGQKGQMLVAANMRKLLAGSEILDNCQSDRVQDAYALRCIPQLHGACRDALEYVREKVEIELNAVTDNPLMFLDDEAVISGGNFHGEPMALPFDFLGIAASEIADASERRTERMVNPALSNGLTAFLTTQAGVNSGFMIVQYAAASMVSENKVYAHPASVDSIPSSANQEDIVSMGTTAARKAKMILQNTQDVLADELMTACQAIDIRRRLNTHGQGLTPLHEAIYQHVRKEVAFYEVDREIWPDIRAVEKMIRSGELLDIVKEYIPDFE